MPTGIEWTDETWNPVTGCTQVSPGCANCYLQRTPPFRKEGRRFTYQGKQEGVTTGVRLHPDRLEQPLKWRKPRRVFVNSLSDLFHEDVPDGFIYDVFLTMAQTPQHIFQVLTKRPERMVEFLAGLQYALEKDVRMFKRASWPGWPLPNVWLGVSAENQHWADQRIPLLLQTPAAVRFVSAEPLLNPLDLTPWLRPDCRCDGAEFVDVYPPRLRPWHEHGCPGEGKGLNWVISGGESGPNARPSHPDWFRQLRDQCAEAGVAFFFKQWGEWRPHDARLLQPFNKARAKFMHRDGDIHAWDANGEGRRQPHDPSEWAAVFRVGKRRAGALLDGREHREFPA